MIVPEEPGLSWPTWAPKGQTIAFQTNQCCIFVVNRDGSGRRTVVGEGRALGLYPEWSPGGRKIAYATPYGDTDAGDAMVMNPDGRHKTTAAQSDGSVSYTMPAWSPDGERLAFRVVQASDTANEVKPSLAYIQQYGGTVHHLSNENVREPDWSPDGRKVVYARGGLESATIRVLDLRRDRSVFLHTGSHPRWSPNGRQIVFEDRGQIYVMNADGSRVRQLTSGP